MVFLDIRNIVSWYFIPHLRGLTTLAGCPGHCSMDVVLGLTELRNIAGVSSAVYVIPSLLIGVMKIFAIAIAG